MGTDIQLATVGGQARYVRDELEAGALCLMSETVTVMFVSCDLGGLETEFTKDAREAMAKAAGLDAGSIIIGAIHTSVFSICDVYSGYCPTYSAVIGGGYSSEPIYWTRFLPEAGYNIVHAASHLLKLQKYGLIQ